MESKQALPQYGDGLGDVNTVPPNTEKWLRKILHENNGYGEKL